MAQTDIFDASASAVGFVHQFRFALYRGLCLLKTGVDWEISIEAADDIEIVNTAGYRSLLQLKHRDPAAVISDSSPDLWKSLRIWSEQIENGRLDVDKSALFLITTGQVGGGTAASLLAATVADRNEEEALVRLNRVAATSTSKSNAKAYAAWEKLGPLKGRTLSAITVVPSSDDIDEVERLIATELTHAVRREHLAALVTRLEGWWFQKCINVLRSPTVEFLAGEELDSYVSGLRESFLPDSLPIDPDVPDLKAEVSTYADYRFTRQIELVGVGARRIADAVRDYHRAITQRSRWLREGLVRPDEISDYEARLTEEWGYVFNRLIDELPAGASEAAMSTAAKEIYRWVEEAIAPPIRSHRPDLFLIRGSLHILADSEKPDPQENVGWHPEFAARLMALLEPVGD